MTIESHLRALLRGLKAALRHWRLLRELDAAIEEREDAIRDLEELIGGARRRLERAAAEAAFRKLLAAEVASVHGIGPTLAGRIAEHPLTGDPGGFRASVERVKGVGEKKKERLLRWEEEARERHRALRDQILEEGGVDPELEATVARLRGEAEREREALGELVERRKQAVEPVGPGRVVLDTNVFVGAGFNPESASAELVREVREGALRMPWTEATRAEVERILTKIPPLSWDDVRELFREEDRLEGSPARDDLGWIPDPDDREFAALARSAGAVLVSSDAHLLAGRSRATFAILTPGEYRGWRRG
ncbi:MAG: PIN domain-containing protein [Gemmatimonadetes bacterium]|nr:PIN domain-containing protein [Gemmatimonadota bacterium]NIR80457.1 PIN domain-containing protein [Gemmatimonadota bacterium]NIT89218.1 PIN domain-containing protein [Gemmatimonadota bacterium]NIU33017.1 PIN domain-containing protein [Gemmatimonadota bacterium]NIU37401.1 PIN domain-containing protein [Gemmatimonadota bacterium]